MLLYLCDECHGPLKPEEYREQTALGAVRHLCRTCLQRRASAYLPAVPPPVQPQPPPPLPAPQAARPPSTSRLAASPAPQTAKPPPAPAQASKAISCEGCQVAQSSNGLPGATFGDRSNPFCATCEKVSSSPGIKFRCHACKSMVGLDDLRSGRALAVAEKVFCSTCKRRSQPPAPVPLKPSGKSDRLRAPPEKEAQEKPSSGAFTAPETGGAEEDPGEPLQCDLCSRSFSLEDLRAGRAEIRESRVLCPRCIARIDRKKEKFDYRFIASLVFIIVVFPLGAAGLVFLAITGQLTGGRNNPSVESGRIPRDAGRETVPSLPAPRPKPEVAPGKPGPLQPPPSGGSPAQGGVKGIPAEALDQIISNLRSPPAAQPRPGMPDLGLPPAGSVGPSDAGDLEALVRMTSSGDPSERLEGILRLASSGCDDSVFLTAVSDRDPFVRSAAAVTLARRKKEAAVGPLLDLIRDPDPSVRRTASKALLEAVNVSVRFVEDFSKEDLEKLKSRLDRILEKKGGEK